MLSMVTPLTTGCGLVGTCEFLLIGAADIALNAVMAFTVSTVAANY